MTAAMAVVEETGLSRILVTDDAGRVLYDTRETGSAVGEFAVYTEIVQALLGQRRLSAAATGTGVPQPGLLPGTVPKPDHRRCVRL